MTEAPMNARVGALLAEIEVSRLQLRLSPATVARLHGEAEARGWTFEQVLEATFLRGVLVMEREMSAVPFDRTGALCEAREAGGLYAALRYQLGKLERGVSQEELRLAGAAGITSTFEELIARLRERLGSE